MPPNKGVKWDDKATAQLFKCVLEAHDIKPDYKKLESKMRDAGYDCTAKAITHRIAAIRTKSMGTNDDNTAPNTTPETSPTKSKAKAKPKPKTTTKAATAGGKRKRTPAAVEDPVGGEEGEGSDITVDDEGVKGEVREGKKVKVEDEGEDREEEV